MQGSTRHDRGKKPEGLRAEASGSAERWPSEADYSFTYRDCELVMNAQPHYHVLDHGNVVFFAVRSNSQEDVAETHSMCRLGGTPGPRRTSANEPHDCSFSHAWPAARLSNLCLES